MNIFGKKEIINPHKYSELLCVICNTKINSKSKTNNTNDVCLNCISIGFRSKSSFTKYKYSRHNLIDHLSYITGITQNNIIIHTIYLGNIMPEHLQLYFLSNIKTLKAKGIVWVDDKQKEQLNNSLHIKSKLSSLNFEVKKITDMINDFKNIKDCSFLSEETRNEIIKMIHAERSGFFSKIAYSVDSLRIIALLLYGGLYLDANIRIESEEFKKNETAVFGAKYMPVKSNNSSNRTRDWSPISGIENARALSAYATNTFPELNKMNIISESHEDYYDKFAKYKYRPECSAILGNKGALFFDLTLYDILNRFKIRNRTYNFYINEKYKKKTEDPLVLKELPIAINTRTPLIINSMLTAQKLIMLKINNFNESYFYFESGKTFTSEEYKEIAALGFKGGAIRFKVFGHIFIKYYSLSHRTNTIPVATSRYFEKNTI